MLPLGHHSGPCRRPTSHPLPNESFENPLRGEELITDPFWERHSNPHKDTENIQVEM